MRLLSFLSDIERSVTSDTPNTAPGSGWDVSRMVNFHHGLARLTLTPRAGASSLVGGTIFLQAFALADGSQCLKASLNWKGSDALPVISVYSTPTLNWKTEARRIAAAWHQGPPAQATVATTEMRRLQQQQQPMLAVAG